MTRKPLGLIPARGSSKRIPRKNLRPLGGKPLLVWTVQAALESGVFDAVWVSSEDPEILALAKEAGAAVIERPLALAGDTVRTPEVLRHALSVLSEHAYTELYTLLPTTPFRRSETIRAAWDAYLAHPGDSLLSLTPLEYPPEWALTVEGGCVVTTHPGARPVRQALTPSFRHDGGHSIVKLSSFLERGDVFGPQTLAFHVPPEEALDIDTPGDLSYAQFLLDRQQESS